MIRPVHLTDLDAATRALLAAPERDWVRMSARIVGQARKTERSRQLVGKPHPDFGTGSLESAVQCHTLAPPGACTLQYRRALAQLLRAME